ncbi:MAG: hypothetical protein M0006_14815 [Magnetospirillum sp.]|nr:hypothetical protein [Magnetospirillum sp.]
MLRLSLIAVIGFAVTVAALVLGFSLDRDEPAEPPPLAAVGTLPAIPMPGTETLPSIDVVRVGRHGDAMIAGRASPNAHLSIFDADRPAGEVTADERGEWVFVPELPFAPGVREVSVRANLSGGGVTEGDSVIVMLPEQGRGPVLAFRMALGHIGRVLQGPPPEAADGSGESAPPALGVMLADRDQDGRLFISGRADPGKTVHLYLDNRFIGRARADGDGDWRLAVRAPRQGNHLLRSDLVDAKGKVLVRVEQPWPAADDLAGSGGGFEASREGHFWRVAKPIYGGASRYVVVYQPSRLELRDPDLLYPGQVFTLSVQ